MSDLLFLTTVSRALLYIRLVASLPFEIVTRRLPSNISPDYEHFSRGPDVTDRGRDGTFYLTCRPQTMADENGSSLGWRFGLSARMGHHVVVRRQAKPPQYR